MADNGQYKFSIGLDGKQLEMDIAQAKKAFDSLVKQAKEAGAKIDGVVNPFEQIGKNTPQIAQAAKQFNGLNVATQQLVRELPAASMGLNTFFLAVSNNLPILADQIKQVNAENKNLAAQGKPTTSVLKQIAGSLFSWQTALVLGVTALSMYGKEIANWVVSLFKGKDALDAIKDAERDLHEARMTGAVDAQEEATNLRLMVSAMQDATLSMDERKTAMQSLQDMYPEYFGNLSEEQMLYGDLTTSVETLIDRLVKLATARNAVNQIVKNEQNKTLLEGTEGYSTYRNQLGLFKGSGHGKYERYEKIYHPSGITVGGRWVETDDERYNSNKSDAYKAVEKAQKDFLKNLKNGNKEQKAIYEQIVDEYDGNIEAYLEALDESNKKLTKTAQGTVTDPGLKAAEAEAKRKETEAKRLEREAEQRRKQAAASSAKLAEDVVRARTEATISAMKDGLDKEIAQINADYDAKERDITERENELKELQGGKLTSAQIADFASLRANNEAMRTNAIANAQEKANERLNGALQQSIEDMNDYYIQYGTLQEKILSATEKYEILIANAQNEGQRMALKAERDALLAEYQEAASDWAKELVDKTTVELNKMLADLETELAYTSREFQASGVIDDTTRQGYLNTINKLNAQIALLKTKLGEAGEAVSDDNWAEATQVFQSIASSAREAADGIDGLDENLVHMLRSLADLAGVATNITASIQALEKAVEAVEKASAVLAIIGAVIQTISYIANIFNENAEATQRATDALQAYNAELERINNENISNAYSNIFGKDEFGEFNARLKAVREYQTEIDKIYAEADRDKYFGRYKGFEPDDMTLSADMRSGWQKFWGTGDENVKKTSLNEFFNNGVLDVEKLKAYYDAYGEYLDESEKELVEKLISNGELLQENIDAVTNYLQDKFGDLGSDITNALLDSFKNGTDAAEAFAEATGKILDRLASDIVNMALIQPIMDNAQKEVLELQNKLNAGEISYEEYLKQTSAILNNTINEAKGATEDAYDMYKAAGIEQNGSSSSSATSKGYQTISQETGSELNGRATDIQGQVHIIAEAAEFNKSMQQQQTLYLQSVSETLAAIKTDTDSIAKNTKVLARIDENIDSMRRTMDNGGGL